ncbi:MAG: hypothetical protein ACRDPO_19040, partial [Streptosporangiaceae bacterium]
MSSRAVVRCAAPRALLRVFSSRLLARLGPGLVVAATAWAPASARCWFGGGLGWRWVYGAMAVQQAGLALLFALTRRAWGPRPALTPVKTIRNGPRIARADPARTPVPSRAVTLAALAFAAVENGIETGAGLWGYLFLTAGR